jgi:hypothetical protein
METRIQDAGEAMLIRLFAGGLDGQADTMKAAKPLTNRIGFAASAALAFFCLATVCLGQGTTTVTFEGQPPGTISGGMAYYLEAGMRFTVLPDGGLFLVGPGVPGYPQDGTGYLEAPDVFVGGGGLEFSLTPAALFNLVSFDAARCATGSNPTLEVVGYENNIMGPTLTTTNYFTVTSANFQTFYLSSSFQNVYEVEILNAPFSLDNVVISGVPEPSCATLVALAALCGLGRAWKRGRRTQ